MEQLYTRWQPGAVPLSEYPRPQLVRGNYTSLNGRWRFAVTDSPEEPARYYGEILVPFAPETALSGVKQVIRPEDFLHYQRTFVCHCADAEERDGKRAPAEEAVDEKNDPNDSAARMSGSGEIDTVLHTDERLLLNFEAVDYDAEVRVNGKTVGRHTGGYTPFSFDITKAVKDGENTLSVTVSDPSDTFWQSRGKQRLVPGGMFYQSTSGIWQSVWMEVVPEKYIERVRITPDIDSGAVELKVLANEGQGMARAEIFDDYGLPENERTKIVDALIPADKPVSLPVHDPHLWSPDDPHLYVLRLTYGEDTVVSYFAMRKFSKEKDRNGHPRFFLNGKPLFLNGVLDQGYWPESGMTQPADEALIFDIQKMKDLGFNMLRKHVKIESRRWYWHCDRLGMPVMQDMVSGGAYNYAFMTVLPNVFEITKRIIPDRGGIPFGRGHEESRRDYVRDAREEMLMLYNSPCIFAWVPFNEGWGQFDAEKITRRIKEADRTRLVDEASGWFDQHGGDFYSVHNYFHVLRFPVQHRRILAMTEYGGMVRKIEGHTAVPEHVYGYGVYRTEKGVTRAYWQLVRRDILRNIPFGLSCVVFTQLSDIEEEANGILTWDRECVKMNEEKLVQINQKIMEKAERTCG